MIKNMCFELSCAYLDGEKLYFIINGFNILFAFDLETNKIDLVKILDEKKICENYSYCDIKLVDNKLIFAPLAADEIVVYDLIGGGIEKYHLKAGKIYDELTPADYVKNWTSVVIGRSIYFIPRRYPAIVEFNTDTKKISYYDEWIPEFHKYIQTQRAYFSYDYFTENKCIYLAAFNSNIIAKFDTENKKTELLYKSFEKCGYSAVEKAEDKIFLCDVESKNIIVKDIKTLETIKIIEIQKNLKLGNAPFIKFILKDGYIYAIPFTAAVILKISIYTYEIKVIEEFDSGINDNRINVACVWEHGEKIGFFNNVTHKIEILDTKTDTFEEIPLIFTEETVNTIKNKLFEKEDLFCDESGIFQAGDFMKYVSGRNKKDVSNERKKNIGESISKAIIGYIG